MEKAKKNLIILFKIHENGVPEAILKADEGLKGPMHKEECMGRTDPRFINWFSGLQYSSQVAKVGLSSRSKTSPLGGVWFHQCESPSTGISESYK